jgi:hypothetical protein
MALAAALFVLLSGCTAAPEASPSLSGVSASAAIQTPSPSVQTPAAAATSASTSATIATPSAAAGSTKTAVADGFYYSKLDDALKKRITGMSFPKNEKDAKITYDDLRYVGLKYYDFDGNVHSDGELIVNAKLAKEVTEIFYTRLNTRLRPSGW